MLDPEGESIQNEHSTTESALKTYVLEEEYIMKRSILAFCMATVLSLSVLASSAFAADVNDDGTVNNPEAVEVDENKLVFWSLFSGGDGSFMDQIIADYNESAPAKQVQSIMLVWADYYTKLQTAVAAGKGPDLGISHASKLPELADQGVVEPLTPYLDELGIDLSTLYAENSIDAVTFDGDIYAIPLDTHPEILYYNTDILSKAGIETNEDGTLDIGSAEEFQALLDQVVPVLEDGQSAISCTNSGDDPYRVWWATYYQMGGTPLISDDGTEITINRDIAIAAAEYIKSLFDDGYIASGITDHQQFFSSGKAAFFFGGTWIVGVLDSTEGLNFDCEMWPQLFDNNSCWADSHTLILPVNPERTEEETLASVQFLAAASAEGGKTWAKSGQIPANQEVLGSEDFTSLPHRNNYKGELEAAKLPSKTPGFYAMKAGMIESLDALWLGEASAEEAIDMLIDELESNI